MDELMLLRELEEDAPPLSAETKNSALMRLRREIWREQRAPARRPSIGARASWPPVRSPRSRRSPPR